MTRILFLLLAVCAVLWMIRTRRAGPGRGGKKCGSCGTWLPADAAYCLRCGRPVSSGR